MVTKAIVQTLRNDAALVALMGSSSRLFAEFGLGDQTVVIKQSSKWRMAEEIRPIKTSRLQVIVSGWEIDAGASIANRVLDALEGLAGQTITVTGIATYSFKTIAVYSEPTLAMLGNSKFFSCNVSINYVETPLS
jgi:hypothetical protein